MDHKRVLIVDDDPDLLFLVAHGVKNLGPNYQVSTAADVGSALKQIQQYKHNLVVTDYMMPNLTGLELIEKVQELSPDTQFILMTAHHDSSGMRNQISGKNLAGFIGKPFTMPELLNVIKDVITEIEAKPAKKVPATAPLSKKEVIKEQLKNLQRQTGARSLLLVKANGLPIYVVGVNDRDRVGRLASFVANNFLAIVELSSLFGDNDSVFSSSYYEGNNYNIYAYNINGDFFLTVLFEAGVKPGTVWFYTKQTATTLKSLLPASKKSTLTHKASAAMAKDFDNLLGNRPESNDVSSQEKSNNRDQ